MSPEPGTAAQAVPSAGRSTATAGVSGACLSGSLAMAAPMPTKAMMLMKPTAIRERTGRRRILGRLSHERGQRSGARGIANVGVLKVLDELRVPISCVTGTSMGAIVGATFAAGRTPAEMEKLVLEADWEEVFRDKPPRGEIAVRRKVDD